MQWSQALAGRVLNDRGLSPEQQIERAYRIVFSRPPNAEERAAVNDFIDRQTVAISGRPASHEEAPMPIPAATAIEPARAAAFVDFCQALLNSNEFLYMN